MKFMNKLQDKLKKAKKDNKGFSLVELIIVIAIMAILVGIVGTQVIPYIDKSRNAKDIQVLSGLCTDAMTAYSSNSADLDPDATYTITIAAPAAGAASTDAVTISTGKNSDKLLAAFKELNSVKNVAGLSLESKAGKDVESVTITCSNGDPMIKVDTTLKAGSKATNFNEIKSK